MDFLTPELFDRLIITNIVVGLLLAGGRFYMDMTRPRDHREQTHDEASQPYSQPDDDTKPNSAFATDTPNPTNEET